MNIVNALLEDTIEDDYIPQISKEKRQEYEAKLPYKFFCELCSFKSKRKSHMNKHKENHLRLEVCYNKLYISIYFAYVLINSKLIQIVIFV